MSTRGQAVVTEKNEDHEDISKKDGPPTWYIFHSNALVADESNSDQEKNCFISQFKTTCYNFRCLNCRKHATEYIEKNPIEPMKNVEYGLFKYTFTFHNTVNKRIGKAIIDYETAFNMYKNRDDAACSIICGASEADSPAPQPNSKNVQILPNDKSIKISSNGKSNTVNNIQVSLNAQPNSVKNVQVLSNVKSVQISSTTPKKSKNIKVIKDEEFSSVSSPIIKSRSSTIRRIY
ncbi:ERV/ALR sulfhydryl oxidase [Orpheovirus IHUMI-LCC2]|uniref:Sulfhydryl oxidase n=1 Tax=Orpheovirus IHUMI-LCC2 TaxID=2023057 RepID=A0A2I2L5Y8_9VIRU|nr:ERV/ALR sulfhydryl oxidase [Orpheovirus IHUMI-LCC2]SNW62931.1 ERV/ALR sulfhydryl oxidase [Orpheovirus IHUMI-LCC2]